MVSNSKKRASKTAEMPRYQRRVLDAISSLMKENGGKAPTLARIGQRLSRSPKYVHTVKNELVTSGYLFDERYKHHSIEITELGYEVLKQSQKKTA